MERNERGIDCIGNAGDNPAAEFRWPKRKKRRATGASANAKGPTLGGHIGFVPPLVTHSGGQTPVWQISLRWISGWDHVKGSGRTPSTSNLSHNTMQQGNG